MTKDETGKGWIDPLKEQRLDENGMLRMFNTSGPGVDLQDVVVDTLVATSQPTPRVRALRMIAAAGLAALLVGSLSGCATTGTPATVSAATTAASATATTIDKVTVKASEGLQLADLAYQTAVPIAEALIAQGVVSTDAALRIRAAETTAQTYLNAAHAALTVAAQADAVAKAVTAIGAIDAATPATVLNQ